MKFRAFILASVCASGSLFAANSNPFVTWDISVDNGASWSRNVVLGAGSPTNVLVRGTAGWSSTDLLPAALAVVEFDGVITGAMNESGGSFVKPLRQTLGNTAGTLVNLGGGNIRFGVTNDSGLPGSNATWWLVGQDANLLDGNGLPTFPDQDTSNPVAFLYFTLAVDYSASHSMTVSSILRDRIGDAVRVYNGGGNGSQTRFSRADVRVEAATIQVAVPGPASVSALGLMCLSAVRRRRN